MLGLHQRHQLYEAFVHVTSTERNTDERLFEEHMFCDGIVLAGAQMSSANQTTSFCGY